MTELNPFIVYIGCAAALINLGFYIRAYIAEKRPKQTVSVTMNYPSTR